MYTIRTNNNETFKARNVFKDDTHDSLFIRTSVLTPIEAYQIFGVKENAKIITVSNDEDPEEVTIYKWYTKIHSVYDSPIFGKDAAITIWLKREYPE